MPAMSVYRILEFLEDQHLVHKLNLANKYVACNHVGCDHPGSVPQFLICRNCSRSKKLVLINRRFHNSETAKNARYDLYTPQVELNCLCESCITANAST